ncbi:MAG: bifunctional oligoribonuclease/PAP phosphatase NrnA [Thermodesulfobacteriota bacterium]
MNEFDELNDLINKSDKILIASHENPDGDALGSTLSLGLGLKKLNKDISYYNKDGVPELLEFLPYSNDIVTSTKSLNGPFDIIFAVDCTGANRAGREFEEYVKSENCRNLVIIDHHETTGSEADIHILDSKASSTGVIIYRFLKFVGIEIDKPIAENIYTTIISDTGSFNYSNTSSETFTIAADLVDKGVDPSLISQALYENEPLRKLELFKLVIPTLEITDDSAIASIYVNKEMFDKTGTSRQDTEGMVNIPRSIKGVEVAILFRSERESDWKLSLRSKGKVNVAKIAESYGGGGHARAAGCSLKGSISEVKSQIIPSIKEALG